MRKTIALAVFTSLAAIPAAFAQVTPVPALVEPAAVPRGAGGFIQTQAADELLATDLLGRPVLNLSNETLGSINNIIYTHEGNVVGVVVGVGGFLGIGVKNVAIAYDAVRLVVEDGAITIVVDATRESLDQATAFATLDDLDLAPVVPPAPVAPAPAAVQVEPAPAPAAAPMEPAPAPAAPAPVEPAPAPAPVPVLPAPAPAAALAPLPGQDIVVAPAVGGPMVIAPPAVVEPAPAPVPPAIIAQATPVPPELLEPAPATFFATQAQTEFLAGEIIGQPILNLTGETLGTVNDVLQTRDGTVTGVIVGVGGFLGIGVKDVAIAFEALRIGILDGERRFVFDADRTALDAAPAFERLP